MRYLSLSLILFSNFVFSLSQPELYHYNVGETGAKLIITEKVRSQDYSVIRVVNEDPDNQASFAVVDAAVDIGIAMRKSHFAIISGEDKADGHYMKIYFPDDINQSPMSRFPGELSDSSIREFNENGYMSIEDLLEVFKLMEQQ